MNGGFDQGKVEHLKNMRYRASAVFRGSKGGGYCIYVRTKPIEGLERATAEKQVSTIVLHNALKRQTRCANIPHLVHASP